MCCSTNSYPHYSVEVSCELQAPANLPHGRTPGPIKWKAGGPRADLSITDKRTISCLCQHFNPRSNLLSECNPATVHHPFQSNSLNQGYSRNFVIHVCK